MDELRYYSRPVPGNREARLSTANRPERSIYGKPQYEHDPATVIQNCHRTLNALRRLPSGNKVSGPMVKTGDMEPERIAKLAAAVLALRGLSLRHGEEYPYTKWRDIVVSLGVESPGATHTQIKGLCQKVMSPDEYEANLKDRARSRIYNFDAEFTMAIGNELEQYGFSLKEAAAAVQCELTPQGHQWRLQQLEPLRAKAAMAEEHHAQTQAQTVDNLSQMARLLLQRRKAAAQVNER